VTLRRRLNRLGSQMDRGPKRPKVSTIDVIDAFASYNDANGARPEKEVFTLVWQCGSWGVISSDGRAGA
jgi:hypothetical protein